MEELLKSLTIFKYDKFNHIFYGVVIYILLLPFYTLSFIIPLSGVMIAALVKELYDMLHKPRHNPSVLDILATILLPLLFTLYLGI